MHNQRIFREGGGGGVWNQVTLINFLSKAQEKEAPQGNILEILLLDTLKTIFLMENLTQRWTQTGTFFTKLEHYFWFSKQAGIACPLPLILHLWVLLNMPQYPSICLNILENAWTNCFDYARALNMLDHLTFLTDFWRCIVF